MGVFDCSDQQCYAVGSREYLGQGRMVGCDALDLDVPVVGCKGEFDTVVCSRRRSNAAVMDDLRFIEGGCTDTWSEYMNPESVAHRLRRHIGVFRECAKQLAEEAEICQICKCITDCQKQCKDYPCDKYAAVEKVSNYLAEQSEGGWHR